LFTDTDIVNGRQFVADHGADVRYVGDWGCWVVFDGRRWVLDRTETLVEMRAKDTTERMGRVAADRIRELARRPAATTDEGAREAIERARKRADRGLAWAKKTQDMRSLRRMLMAARSEPVVNVRQGRDVFDLHPHLLNCENGTVDLRTGALHPH